MDIFENADIDQPGNAECDGAAIRCELENILSSRTFRAARSQRKFIRFAVEEVLAGRGAGLKEFVIGVDAFGRGESFDPRLDPIVRTEARKLRVRLARYYESEGKLNGLRVELPKGSYVPVFRSNASDPPSAEFAEINLDASGIDDKEPPPATLVSRRRPAWKFMAITLLILVLLGSGAITWYVSRSNRREMSSLETPSVAIMPFVNLSDNQKYDFLGDGLTEDLINALAQVSELRVVARNSAFHFKGKQADIRQIGEQLRTRAVLLGSIRGSGQRLRVSVQLMSAPDASPLWSGNYDLQEKDVSAVHREISSAVANALGANDYQRVAHSVQKLPGQGPVNPGAYQNYLLGLHFWNKLNADSLRKAMRYFELAIADDPSFARAYTALAHSYVMAPQLATAASPEAISKKIRELALKALELDSTLGEAHIALAICAQYEFDWATAEREFKKGLELSPNHAVGHLWYAKYLALVGRQSEVLVHRRIGAELDPVSPYAIQAVGGYLSVMGRYDEAIEQFKSALALDPNFGLARQGLGVAYILKGKPEIGIAELQAACILIAGPRRDALLGYGYGVSGRAAEARQILKKLQAQSRRGPLPSLAIAQVYIGLGDKDHAFEWLKKAIDERDLGVTLQWDSLYEPLRSDPRYIQLLRRMKLV